MNELAEPHFISSTTALGPRWTRWVPLVVTCFALAYILYVVPWRDNLLVDEGVSGAEIEVEPGVITLLAQARLAWLGTAFLCVIATSVLAVTRWRFMLQTGPEVLQFRSCAIVWARAQIMAMTPFGQLAAETYRIHRSTAMAGNLARALGIVGLERFAGVAALGTLVFTGFLAAPIHVRADLRPLIIVLCAAGGLAGLALAWWKRNRLPVPASAPTRGWLERVWRSVEPAIAAAIQPWRASVVIALSLAIQTANLLVFVAIDRSLSLGTPVWCYLIAVPAITLAQFLPIHIMGIGIIEGGLVTLLGAWMGYGWTEAVSVGVGVRACGLVWTGILALAFLVPDRAAPAHVPSVTTRTQDPVQSAGAAG